MDRMREGEAFRNTAVLQVLMYLGEYTSASLIKTKVANRQCTCLLLQTFQGSVIHLNFRLRLLL